MMSALSNRVARLPNPPCPRWAASSGCTAATASTMGAAASTMRTNGKRATRAPQPARNFMCTDDVIPASLDRNGGRRGYGMTVRPCGRDRRAWTPRYSIIGTSSALVFVVTAVPAAAVQVAHALHHRLVAAFRRAIEPLIHAPEPVEAAHVRRIGVVHVAALERKGAHARRVPGHRRDVGAVDGENVLVAQLAAGGHRAVVVFDDAGALLLLAERHAVVVVEVALERGRPRKRPPHPLLVGLQLRERRARHRPKHHVMVGQVHHEPVKTVGDGRARWAARLVVGP